MFNSLKNKKLVVELEVQKYKEKCMKEAQNEIDQMVDLVQRVAKQSAIDTGNYEHEYHYGKERKGIELALLDAQLINLRENVDSFNQRITEKDEEIKRLSDMITKMLGILEQREANNI